MGGSRMDPRWSSGDPRWITGEGLTPNPPGSLVSSGCCRNRTLCSPPRPQSSSQCFGTAFPLRWPLQLCRWRSCPAHAQHLHTRSAAELDLAEPKFCPCPDPTDPPDLLPPIPQCSVGLCGILNVCKKSQVFLLYKETKHSPLLLPLHFSTPKAAIQ